MKSLEILPKGAKTEEERAKLAQKVSDAIDAGLRQKGGLRERTALNSKLVQNRNVRPDKLPWKDAQHFHIPLIGPKLNQRKANIVATVTMQDPVFRFSSIGDRRRIDAIERTVQFFLDISGWKERFDRALQIAMEANTAIWRVTFQNHPGGWHGASHTGPYAGLVFDVIHPDNFVVYPAGEGGIPSSRVCGHCFDMRRGEARQRIKTGEWLEAKLSGSDSATVDSFSAERTSEDLQGSNDASVDDSDDNLVFWDVIWRDDLDGDGIEKLYRIILRQTAPEIVYIEPYQLDLHWYVDMSIKYEPGRFWAEGSPAQDGQGLQLLMNALVNEYIWATQMMSRPAILTEGWQLDESMVGYEPGEYRNVRSVGKAMPVPSAFNPAGYEGLIQLVKMAADSVTKTSDAVTGAPAVSRESTATEQNIKFQAFQIGSSDDISAITPALRRLVVLSLTLLKRFFDTWYEVYGGAVPVQSVDELEQAFTVELAGKSPADSPQLQSEQAQMLLQLAVQAPQMGIPIVDLVKSIVGATSLPNKDDILRAIDEAAMAAQGVPVDANGVPQDPSAGGVDMGTLLEILRSGGIDVGAGQYPAAEPVAGVGPVADPRYGGLDPGAGAGPAY